MLVLTRKEKQTILVGDDIEITICRVSGRRVSIGLTAPKDVDIRRGEIRAEGQPLSQPVAGLSSRLPSSPKLVSFAESGPAFSME